MKDQVNKTNPSPQWHGMRVWQLKNQLFCSWRQPLCNPTIETLLLLSFIHPARHQICGYLFCGHCLPTILSPLSRLSFVLQPAFPYAKKMLPAPHMAGLSLRSQLIPLSGHHWVTQILQVPLAFCSISLLNGT